VRARRQICDLVIAVARADPRAEPAHAGISLLLVEADAPGFVRGRKLEKLGLRGQDTSELDCAVPAANLLGAEGQGFRILQLHGGYGFMCEYPISGDYADAAVQSIYAGTNEIMKVVIARELGLE
jgi:alkylation response protein AidB-like acyl-CoA dehydrogenase